jgi:hypothetical protein
VPAAGGRRSAAEREQVVELFGPGREHLGRSRVRRAQQRPQCRRDGPERGTLGDVEPAAAQHDRAVGGSARGQLLHEAGLASARLAAQDHRRHPARLHRTEGGGQIGEVVVPADQTSRLRRTLAHAS